VLLVGEILGLLLGTLDGFEVGSFVGAVLGDSLGARGTFVPPPQAQHARYTFFPLFQMLSRASQNPDVMLSQDNDEPSAFGKMDQSAADSSTQVLGASLGVVLTAFAGVSGFPPSQTQQACALVKPLVPAMDAVTEHHSSGSC